VPTHLRWLRCADGSGGHYDQPVFWHSLWRDRIVDGVTHDQDGSSHSFTHNIREMVARAVNDVFHTGVVDRNIDGGQFESCSSHCHMAGVMSLLAWATLVFATLAQAGVSQSIPHIADVLAQQTGPHNLDEQMMNDVEDAKADFFVIFAPDLHCMAAETRMVPLHDLFLAEPLGDPSDTIDWDTARSGWTRCMVSSPAILRCVAFSDLIIDGCT
jgi:hypothetical protein